MPSLRKRVSTYFRQLSFHNEPRQKRFNINENVFITKYLQGHISLKEGPSIIYGKNPSDLPNYELAEYETGYESIVSCYSGPHGGLTTIRRREKHLSIPDAEDLDFIDTPKEEIVQPILQNKSPKRIPGQPVDNTKMVIKVAGQEYFVKNATKKHKKSQSLGSISDFKIEIEKTKIDKEFYSGLNENNNKYFDNKNKLNDTRHVESQDSNMNIEIRQNDKVKKMKVDGHGESKKNVNVESSKCDKDNIRSRPPKSKQTLRNDTQVTRRNSGQKNSGLMKSKSEGNPFRHKGVRKCVERPKCGEKNTTNDSIPTVIVDDSNLPHEWNRKSDYVFGISDSLYDTNLVTKIKNGDPIADCFGVIARKDSMILAVADGVNWGEKACIAAKSAIHGCLHYLNKTIFNDIKLFENLIVLNDQQTSPPSIGESTLTHVGNTREVFVCLLRAFSCAHELILENNGMLTTLTVAVVLPVKNDATSAVATDERKYVCCVCNVGDTLAYVYSGKYGIRELTKGSHDVNSNRDMRDALGALGPVDGINPELSNLTLSLTYVNEGDIVLVASDGLTDNFDPNVCRFSVNATAKTTNNVGNKNDNQNRKKPSQSRQFPVETVDGNLVKLQQQEQQQPVKPPRRSNNRNSRNEKRGESVEVVEAKGSGSVGRKNEEVEAAKLEEREKLMENPLVQHFMKQHSVEESARKDEAAPKQSTNETSQPSQSSHKISSSHPVPSGPQAKASNSQRPQQAYSFLRSKTTIDFHSNKKPILRNEEGIPYVTPVQRYELQLLLMEDVLQRGISGHERPCAISRKLCENLVDFTLSITAAKRRTLEDGELYYDNKDGVMVELTPGEKKQRRKRGLEKVQSLPGKLDHVTVVAANVGQVAVKV